MPQYEYICINSLCDKQYFKVLKITYGDSPERCPECRIESSERKNFYQINFTM